MDLRVTALTGRETLCIVRANMKKTLVYDVNEYLIEAIQEKREKRNQSLLR